MQELDIRVCKDLDGDLDFDDFGLHVELVNYKKYEKFRKEFDR